MYTPRRDAGSEGHYWNMTIAVDVIDVAVQLVFLVHDGHAPGQKVSHLTEPQGLSSCSQVLNPVLSQLNLVHTLTFYYLLRSILKLCWSLIMTFCCPENVNALE
jgi:hypothetical protein